MAYDAYLAERIRKLLTENHAPFSEKKMMGGLCFMMDDKMLCGLLQDKNSGKNLLMARIGEEAYEEALKQPYCLPMDFTGRPMRGYVFVQEEGLDSEEQLEHWVELCKAFNPFAKSSKKKKKS